MECYHLFRSFSALVIIAAENNMRHLYWNRPNAFMACLPHTDEFSRNIWNGRFDLWKI